MDNTDPWAMIHSRLEGPSLSPNLCDLGKKMFHLTGFYALETLFREFFTPLLKERSAFYFSANATRRGQPSASRRNQTRIKVRCADVALRFGCDEDAVP